VDDFGVAVVAGCLEHGLFDAYVDFCPFEGLVTEHSFDVCAIRKKIERRGLEVVDHKAHRTITTSLRIPDDLPSVEEVPKEFAGALKEARMANHDKVDVQARWLVPEMVKNGLKSYFVFSRLIWACFVGESWSC
jgi:hypothetical protein